MCVCVPQRKGKEVTVQRERYLGALKTSNYQRLQPEPRISVGALAALTEDWEKNTPAGPNEVKRIHSLRRSYRMSGFGGVCEELECGSPASAATPASGTKDIR